MCSAHRRRYSEHRTDPSDRFRTSKIGFVAKISARYEVVELRILESEPHERAASGGKLGWLIADRPLLLGRLDVHKAFHQIQAFAVERAMLYYQALELAIADVSAWPLVGEVGQMKRYVGSCHACGPRGMGRTPISMRRRCLGWPCHLALPPAAPSKNSD